MTVEERVSRIVKALPEEEAEKILRELESRIAENEEDVRDARAALKEADTEGTVSWEEIKADLGLNPLREGEEVTG
jgi:DNA-binding transcriptional ArsR family regulator